MENNMCLLLRKFGQFGRDAGEIPAGEMPPSIKWGKDGEITGYKVYRKEVNSLESTCYQCIVKSSGQVISNRKSINLTEFEKTSVDYGIHVFLNKKDAIDEMRDYIAGEHVIIPVRCKKQYLVTTGWYWDMPSAVFMKVLIDNKTWKRIWK